VVFITDAESTEIYKVSSHKFVGDPDDPEGSGYQKESLINHPKIPKGEFLAHAIAFGDRVSIHSVSGSANGQIAPVEILILDQEKRTDWLLEVRDAETREFLDQYLLEIRPEKELKRSFQATRVATAAEEPSLESPSYEWGFGAAGMVWKKLEGTTPLVGMSESLQFKWWVTADGYEAGMGNELNFMKLPSGQRSATIFLKRKQ